MYAGDEYYGDDVTSGPADDERDFEDMDVDSDERNDRDEPVDLVDYLNNLRSAMWGTR